MDENARSTCPSKVRWEASSQMLWWESLRALKVWAIACAGGRTCLLGNTSGMSAWLERMWYVRDLGGGRYLEKFTGAKVGRTLTE